MIFLETQLVPRNSKTAGLILLWYWDTFLNGAKRGSYNAKFKSFGIVGSSLTSIITVCICPKQKEVCIALEEHY